MGLEEKIRRQKFMERLGRLLDEYSDTWRIEEEPGAIRVMYASAAPEEPADEDEDSLAQLRDRARDAGVRGFSRMDRAELLAALAE